MRAASGAFSLALCLWVFALPAASTSREPGGSRAVTWLEQQKLVPIPSGPVGEDHTGHSVAISGDTVIVGAHQADVGGQTDRGRVYAWVLSAGSWVAQAFPDSPAGASGRFGGSVAIVGDTALVGAPGQSRAFVYLRDAGIWSLQQGLSAPGYFGNAVALEDDLAVIGAPAETIGANDYQGSVSIFTRSAGVWTLQQKLTASDGAAGYNFGWSVAVSGDTVVVGSPYASVGATVEQGAAYVFVRSGGIWSEQQKLASSEGASGDRFGVSVALSGDTALVGAHLHRVGASDAQGAAYVFSRSAGAWSEAQQLTDSIGQAGDLFGWSSSISGDTIAIGAPTDEPDGSNAMIGSASIFRLRGGLWTQQQKVTASDGASGDQFGYSITVSGGLVVAGAPYDNDYFPDRGSAYVFLGRLELGDPCTAGIQCHGEQCVDGVCCDGECGGGLPSDCMACSFLAGGTSDGFCGPLTATVAPTIVCREAAGPCDLPEDCTPASADCPPDALQPAITVCRPAAGACDTAESCTGASGLCPDDVLAAAGVPCREVAGPCDLSESCSGSSAACPPDTFQPDTFECRAPAAACDRAERCTGGGAACPADSLQPSIFVCRPAAGPCDLAESCSGSAAGCPEDSFQPAGLECRVAAGWCDLTERCTGAGASCPDDSFRSSTYECRPAAGVCDPGELCPGNSPDCPADSLAAADTACRAGSCTHGVETDTTYCNGTTVDCPAATTSPCDPYTCGPDACLATCSGANDCLPGYRCDAGSCVSAGAQGAPCLAAAECLSEFCVDGFCCDGACTGQCEGCDLAGSEGACGPVEGEPHGERTPCAADGSVCDGACDGT
ncbi:MAG TPA: hypothetical protein PK668_28270, partial [Myxococcota bacterium]|nr:hypothetical protein [Myxococcota bacterium]HRY97399.1 hypothetical protein [Myxococcota bacterium]